MNITASEVKSFLISNGYKVNKIEKLKNGGANINYKFQDENEKYAIKFYQRDYYFDLSDRLINILKKYSNAVTTNEVSILKLQNRVTITKFIDGKHRYNYTEEEIDKILSIIKFYTDKTDKIDKSSRKTIYNKLNEYYNYFVMNINNLKKVSKDIIIFLNDFYNSLELYDNSSMCIIHGDLSNSNILWVNNNPIIIDFDECVYAHREYELASFVIKSSFSNGNLNIDLAKKIINKSCKLFKKLDKRILKNYIYFFILKVIYEKLYFYEITDLDLESDEQKKDYWLWWYNLIVNNYIDNLF